MRFLNSYKEELVRLYKEKSFVELDDYIRGLPRSPDWETLKELITFLPSGESNEVIEGLVFSTNAHNLLWVNKIAQENEFRVWTLIACDESDEWFIAHGLHRVNALGWLVDSNTNPPKYGWPIDFIY